MMLWHTKFVLVILFFFFNQNNDIPIILFLLQTVDAEKVQLRFQLAVAKKRQERLDAKVVSKLLHLCFKLFKYVV